MYNFLRAFLICIVTYGTIFQLNAQTEYESISNEDIFEHKHLKPLEILDIFKARYQKSLQEQNEASQFELAKYIAHASYRASKTSEIDYWLAKVDSLGKIVAPEKYDKSLEFLKITWAHANKQTAKAMTLLEKMKPYAEMTEDTIWKIDYHIKMVNTYSSFDDQAVALKNLFEAETLNSKFKGRLQEALILDSKSAIEWEKRDHQKSLNYELQACNIFEELDYKNNLAAVYSNIIAKATTIGNTKIADQFMQKLNKHHKKMGCQTCFLTGEMNRIYFYITQAKYREALALADTLTIFADTMNRE